MTPQTSALNVDAFVSNKMSTVDSMTSFERGQRVVLREIMGDKVWTARPMTVVRDEPEQIVLLLTVGTVYQYPKGVQPSQLAVMEWLSGDWELIEREWYGHDILRFTVPGQPWDVWWPAPGTAADWYINFQSPLRRARDGFETLDHVLDLIVSRDGRSWRWKDQEDFHRATELGILSEEKAQGIQAEGERIVERLSAGEIPWDTGWATHDLTGIV